MNIQDNYFKLPNDIFDLDLKPSEFVVLSLLMRYENNNDYSYPSYDHIAEKCHMTRRNAIRMINSLINKGYIEKHTRRTDKMDNDSNMYVVTICHQGSEEMSPNKEQSYKEQFNIRQTEFDGVLSKYCEDRFGMPLRNCYNIHEYPQLDGIEESDFIGLLDDYVETYDQCNYDYIAKIQYRLL